jgi:TonB family protein
MPCWVRISLLSFFWGFPLFKLPLMAQQAEGERKVTTRIAPTYPSLARTMNLQGNVKLHITVAPNGTPKVVDAIGGNPVLVKAAQDAVYKWRWTPSPLKKSKRLEELPVANKGRVP